MTEFLHAIRASAPTGYIGPPTRSDLAAINERIALVPQDEGDLFTWSFEISNNHIDSHGTWMDRSSLDNYARQANTGRGVPYMRNHDTDTEERGRVFRGALTHGEKITPSVGGIPLARDLFRKPVRETHLVETAFMVRGLALGGTNNDDLIANIEAGVAASNSIGFSVYTPGSPGSYLECDVCGLDLFEKGGDGQYVCPHFPGMVVQAAVSGQSDPVAVVATARVVNATQREASGVYLGSTPGTYTMASRGHELYESGRVSENDARRLEEILRLERGVVTLGHPERLYSIPKGITTGAISNPTSDDDGRQDGNEGDMSEHDYDAVARVREVLSEDPDRLAAIELADVSLETDPVGALHTAMADGVGRAERERDEAVASFAEFKRVIRERLHLTDGEDIAAGLDRLTADADVAREYRGGLTDELLRQMTRAGLTYDEPEQRLLADRLTPKQLRAQTEMYRTAANGQLSPGRVSEPQLQERQPIAKRRPVGYTG